jgi:cation:H+ antiporter
VESALARIPLALDGVIALVSLAILVGAADFAIARAVATARQYGVSPLIIGTTLVAMSTSLAELAVNMAVTLSGGNNAVVVGNIFGSNLVNIGLGLGIPALLIPIRTATVVIEREIVLYFGVTGLFTALVLDSNVSRGEGALLVVCFVIIMFLVYQYASREREASNAVPATPAATRQISSTPGLNTVLVLGSLIILVLSAEVLVESVTVLARAAGISSYIISLTVIGIGTSLPEIATSIGAARQRQVDLVLGNVFGSNIFNICIALGLPALIRPVQVPSSGLNDIYFINVYGIVAAFLLLGEFRFLGRYRVIGRWGGALLAVTYIGYLAYKIATSSHAT